MLKRALMIAILSGVFTSISATAQSTCGSTKLYCLIPTAFHTTTATFNFFNEAFGTQVSQLPLATPASGFIFTFDKSLGVYTASNESFGPILTERAETIGRHKLYVAFTYQHFGFDEIDGTNLKNVPIVFAFPSVQHPSVLTATTNRVDAKIDQYAAFASFGLTNRIDVSVAIPFERVSMGVSSKGTEYSTTTTAKTSFQEFLPGSASGIGDLVLAAKGTAFKGEHFRLALGTEVRLPSGDERNFLGSGAVGVKPYIVLSRRGRIAPHLDMGYQWNGNSFLATDQNGKKQQLPTFFSYSGGADIGVSKRLTVVADLLGQRFFDAPQISSPKSVSIPNQTGSFSSVEPLTGSYSADNLGLGVKVSPVGHLLITANVLIKLDHGGLRSKVVPMAGLSYSF
jgi:hypothetical protein